MYSPHAVYSTCKVSFQPWLTSSKKQKKEKHVQSFIVIAKVNNLSKIILCLLYPDHFTSITEFYLHIF